MYKMWPILSLKKKQKNKYVFVSPRPLGRHNLIDLSPQSLPSNNLLVVPRRYLDIGYSDISCYVHICTDYFNSVMVVVLERKKRKFNLIRYLYNLC